MPIAAIRTKNMATSGKIMKGTPIAACNNMPFNPNLILICNTIRYIESER